MHTKRDVTSLFLLILILFCNTSHAQGNTAQELTKQYMDKSGLREQTALIVQEIGSAFSRGNKETSPGNFPAEISAKLNEFFSQAFQPDDINNTLQNHLTTRIVSADMEKVLSWLESPLGKKIIGSELASLSPEGQEAQNAIAQEKANTPDNTNRINLLLRLDKALRATKFAVDLQMDLQLAMLTAVYGSMGMDKTSMSRLKENLEENRFHLEGLISQNILTGSLYTYRNLTDAELEQYIDFNKSEHASHINRIIQDGLLDAFIQCSSKLGEKMATLFKTRSAEEKKELPVSESK